MRPSRIWRILQVKEGVIHRGQRPRWITPSEIGRIDPLQDPVTWYGINYTGTQMTQWDFENKRTLTSPARLSFVLEDPLRHLRPSVIYSIPCDQILQRAHSSYPMKAEFNINCFIIIQNISPLLKEFCHFALCFSAHQT